jgi:hypothetical protein
MDNRLQFLNHLKNRKEGGFASGSQFGDGARPISPVFQSSAS